MLFWSTFVTREKFPILELNIVPLLFWPLEVYITLQRQLDIRIQEVAEHNYMKYRFIKRSPCTKDITTCAIHHTTECKENLQYHPTVSTKLEYTNILKARSQTRSSRETRKPQSSFFQVFPALSFRMFSAEESKCTERCTSKELTN